jgi:SDR family mycofactocin-dependent oxidoreductase
MGRFDGKVVFITGIARGQGRSHAIGFAREGADIFGVDICGQIQSVSYPLSTIDDLRETERLVQEVGGAIGTTRADVRDLSALRAAAESCVLQFGRIDIVLPNAGILTTIGERANEDDTFGDVIDVCLVGVWNTIRATIPTVIHQGYGGSVIITSSTAGLTGAHTDEEAGTMGYTAAKHGVVGLMRAYSNMLAKHNIRVNAIHPCGVRTPMVVNDAFNLWAELNPDAANSLRNPLPVDLIEPEDVTAAILWLASESARYVTGISLPVDAGYTNRP